MTPSEVRQAEILAQAARLFREKGYLATSIRDIGEAVGVTSAALYYHFKNKDELLREVVCRGVQVVHEAVREAVEKEDEFFEKVRVGMRVHLLTSLEYQDFSAVILQEMRYLGPEDLAVAIAKRDAYESFWAELAEEAQKRGVLRKDIDAHLLRLLGLGALNWILTWFKPGGRYTAEQIADTQLEFFAYGVVPPDGRASILPEGDHAPSSFPVS